MALDRGCGVSQQPHAVCSHQNLPRGTLGDCSRSQFSLSCVRVGEYEWLFLTSPQASKLRQRESNRDEAEEGGGEGKPPEMGCNEP